MLHVHGPHFLRRLPEGIQPGAEGEGRTGQDPAIVGLVVQLSPGHFPEGFPGAAPGHFFALQQIPEQEGLGGQGRNTVALNGVLRPGDTIGFPQQGQSERLAVKGNIREPFGHVFRR